MTTNQPIPMDDEKMVLPPEVEQEIDAAIDAYIAELSKAIDEHIKNLDKDRQP
jgi:hypothetical protein